MRIHHVQAQGIVNLACIDEQVVHKLIYVVVEILRGESLSAYLDVGHQGLSVYFRCYVLHDGTWDGAVGQETVCLGLFHRIHPLHFRLVGNLWSEYAAERCHQAVVCCVAVGVRLQEVDGGIVTLAIWLLVDVQVVANAEQVGWVDLPVDACEHGVGV